MDAPVRRLTIAEQAERAARIAAETLQHQPNAYAPGTDEHAAFAAAYTRYFEAMTSPESEGSA